MKDKIPEDVMRAARNAAGHIYAPENNCHSYASDIIARAILAERKRCAEVAREEAQVHDTPFGSQPAYATAFAIMSKIEAGA